MSYYSALSGSTDPTDFTDSTGISGSSTSTSSSTASVSGSSSTGSSASASVSSIPVSVSTPGTAMKRVADHPLDGASFVAGQIVLDTLPARLGKLNKLIMTIHQYVQSDVEGVSPPFVTVTDQLTEEEKKYIVDMLNAIGHKS